jgi:DNA polymerase V
LANHIAKTAERKPGSYPDHHAQVCNLGSLDAPEREALMQASDVREVWGVRRKIGDQLKEAGIHTVLDLARLYPGTVKRRWSVVLERTVRELQGTDCIGLEHEPACKQEIAYTRSFGQAETELPVLQEAVTEFASRAAQKLRHQNGHAGQVLAFIRTSPVRTQDLQYSSSTVVPLRRPSSDSRDISQAALRGLQAIYRPGYRYAKAGVMLLDLSPSNQVQQELALDDGVTDPGGSRLMQALDAVIQRFGRGMVALASAGLSGDGRHWCMKQERRTPGYTTDWDGLALVRA